MNEPQLTDTGSWLEPGRNNAQLIYILYFLSFVIGITVLIGLIMAYLNRGRAGEIVETHYTWLIRTFWIGLLYSMISFVLTIALIGFFLMFAVVIWVVIRLVKGLQLLGRGEPVPDTQTWWI
ncbi:MAG: DUF4870 family protein [Rhizobiaceae bacterium]